MISDFASLRKHAAMVATSEDFFYQEGLLQSAFPKSDYLYIKSDYLFAEGCWRGQSHGPISRYPTVKRIFVGHSDLEFSISEFRRLPNRFKFKEIFATNLTIPRGLWGPLRVRPLPLGLSNPTQESPRHVVLGDHSQISQVALEETESPRPRVYSNFDPETSPERRDQLHQIVKTHRHVIIGTTSYSRDGRLNYLREMKAAGIVLCPAGNGLDTHRFWESLLVGALPAVLQKSYQALLARHLNLPCIELRSWDELRDEGSILRKARQRLRRPYSFLALRASYWRAKSTR